MAATTCSENALLPRTMSLWRVALHFAWNQLRRKSGKSGESNLIFARAGVSSGLHARLTTLIKNEYGSLQLSSVNDSKSRTSARASSVNIT